MIRRIPRDPVDPDPWALRSRFRSSSPPAHDPNTNAPRQRHPGAPEGMVILFVCDVAQEPFPKSVVRAVREIPLSTIAEKRSAAYRGALRRTTTPRRHPAIRNCRLAEQTRARTCVFRKNAQRV